MMYILIISNLHEKYASYLCVNCNCIHSNRVISNLSTTVLPNGRSAVDRLDKVFYT